MDSNDYIKFDFDRYRNSFFMADCASVEGSCNGRSAVVSVYFLSNDLCLADYGLYQYHLLSFCDADPLFVPAASGGVRETKRSSKLMGIAGCWNGCGILDTSHNDHSHHSGCIVFYRARNTENEKGNCGKVSDWNSAYGWCIYRLFHGMPRTGRPSYGPKQADRTVSGDSLDHDGTKYGYLW